MEQKNLVESIVRQVIARIQDSDMTASGKRLVPVAVSARHVHLSQEHVEILFGRGYTLKPRNPLSQPGQFAAEETVNIIGPKKVLNGVRVLGPARGQTQVELSVSDAISLGVSLPVRDSGDVKGSTALLIGGPMGCVHIPEGVIAARRHLHASCSDAARLGLRDKQVISVRCRTVRPVVFEDILVRVSDSFALEMHLDTDEANACLVKNGDLAEII